jgi:hypothetical protein
MRRGALIAIFVVLLSVTVPCATFVVLGWIFVATHSRTVSGQGFLFVNVARPDEVVKHPFWQTAPTSAELQKLTALLTTPGVQTVALDDRGHTAAFTASSGRTIPADFSPRIVWVRCNPHWDLPRAHGELKARLDAFVTAEAAKKAATGGQE